MPYTDLFNSFALMHVFTEQQQYVVRPEKRKQRGKKSLKSPTLGRFGITAIYCKSRCQGQPEKTLTKTTVKKSLITQAPLKTLKNL